jgi:hypothetical protein
MLLLEDMLISPRLDSRSPHWRPFPAASPELLAVDADVQSNKDQNRSKPRFSSTSLPDVDW